MINFATGVHATEEIGRSLTNCLEKVRTPFEAFVAEILVTKSDGSDQTMNFTRASRTLNTSRTYRLHLAVFNGDILEFC